jgi:hypothetical protein
MRKLEQCINCGEERELAAFHLCFKCYRQRERAFSSGPVDRHTAVITKERQKLFLAYAQLMTSLAKLGVNKTDVESVVEIVRPYLTPISEQLRFAGMATGQPCEGTPAPPDLGHRPEEKAGTVNTTCSRSPFTGQKISEMAATSEQTSCSPFTCSLSGGPKRLASTSAQHPENPALAEKHGPNVSNGKGHGRRQCAKARLTKRCNHRSAKTYNGND